MSRYRLAGTDGSRYISTQVSKNKLLATRPFSNNERYTVPSLALALHDRRITRICAMLLGT